MSFLKKGKSITFCWSHGHVNIYGNEDAEKAAKYLVTFKAVFFCIQNSIPKTHT